MDNTEATTRIVEALLAKYKLHELKDKGISESAAAEVQSIGKNVGTLYKAVYAAVNEDYPAK